MLIIMPICSQNFKQLYYLSLLLFCNYSLGFYVFYYTLSLFFVCVYFFNYTLSFFYIYFVISRLALCFFNYIPSLLFFYYFYIFCNYSLSFTVIIPLIILIELSSGYAFMDLNSSDSNISPGTSITLGANPV